MEYCIPTKALARVVDDESNITKHLVSARAAKKATPSDLVELAREVQRADEEVRHVASGKLQIIAEQIRFLQEQAKKVLDEARDSTNLNNAKCNFVKKPGNVYYLYERSSGTVYFSMLGPQEWADCPHVFMGAYRYEQDRTWTKMEDIKRKDQELKVIDNLLTRGGVPSLEYITTGHVENPKIEGSEQR